MTKTFALTMSLALVLTGFAATQAQAAARYVDISAERLADRCAATGGAFSYDGAAALCQTETVAVQCNFITPSKAACRWPGVDSQVAVTRLIGLANRDSLGSMLGAGAPNGKGGGFNGPDDFQANPGNPDPKPNFDGPKDFQMAP